MDDLSAVRDHLAVPGPSRETFTRGRARLDRVIARERTAGRRRWLALGLGVSAAAAATAVVISTTAVPQEPPTARQILLAAATSISRQPSEGAWWGNKLVRGVRLRDPDDRYTLQRTEAEETWIPVGAITEPHWIVQRHLGARPATPQDEAAWRAAGSPTSWTYRARTGAEREVLRAEPGEATSIRSEDVDWRLMFADKPLARMDELPTTPEGLRELLETDSRDLPALLHNLSSFIIHLPVTSETRAAAYQLMASLPGVSAQGQATDQLGRTGQAVTYLTPDPMGAGEQVRMRLIVDSGTGEPLAEETFALDTGELIRFTAVQESVWTDSRPDFPAQRADDAVAAAPAGRYWRVRTVTTRTDHHPVGGDDPYHLETRRVSEDWSLPDGRRWSGFRELGARPKSAADRAAWRRDGSPVKWRYRTEGMLVRHQLAPGKGRLTRIEGVPEWFLARDQRSYAELSALPTDPQALKDWLVKAPAEGERPVPAEHLDRFLFSSYVSVLHELPVSREVRQAAYRALLAVPGVTTADGGTRIAFTEKQPDHSVTEEVVVDTEAMTITSRRVETLLKGKPLLPKTMTTTIEAGWVEGRPTVPEP
ncbi:hypothetical protein HII36_40790 [Nonomuraea sp. NN258]|uniref:hypothetical protein n=1 Tax=Nonomuraea antri TaxID=2730852 RepID=UPI00156A393D|nr:hypothetical protein [Nonomuraea antri]NRQ38124.1 hypothetical protein [Nonomuraea antri]